MTTEILFWLLMILWAIFGVFAAWPAPGPTRNYYGLGNQLLLFILILILGVKEFGWPFKG